MFPGKEANVLYGKGVPRTMCVLRVMVILEGAAKGIDKSLKEHAPKDFAM